MAREGASSADVAKALEVSEATVGRRWSQYGVMRANEVKGLRQLRDENGRLKRMVADLAPDKEMLKDVAREHSEPGSPESRGVAPVAHVWGLAATGVPGSWKAPDHATVTDPDPNGFPGTAETAAAPDGESAAQARLQAGLGTVAAGWLEGGTDGECNGCGGRKGCGCHQLRRNARGLALAPRAPNVSEPSIRTTCG